MDNVCKNGRGDCRQDNNSSPTMTSWTAPFVYDGILLQKEYEEWSWISMQWNHREMTKNKRCSLIDFDLDLLDLRESVG